MTWTRAAQIVDALIGAGVRATADPRNINTPCVLVPPPDLRADVACGVTATWRLRLILPGPWNADTWRAADLLLPAIDALFDITAVTPDTITDPPTFEITFEEALQWQSPSQS